MIQIFGWIGLGLLVLSFSLLNTKWIKYFTIVDIIATAFLLAHSIAIKDIPFIISNILIITFLSIKHKNGGVK